MDESNQNHQECLGLDTYTWADYCTDAKAFETMQMDAALSAYENAVNYFDAMYPPKARADTCLALFWRVRSFLDRNWHNLDTEHDDQSYVIPLDVSRAAWAVYSTISLNTILSDEDACEQMRGLIEGDEEPMDPKT